MCTKQRAPPMHMIDGGDIHACRRSCSPSVSEAPPRRPTASTRCCHHRRPPSTSMDAISSPTNDAHEEDNDAVADRPNPPPSGHRCPDPAAHHNDNDEHIPDPSRPQANDDHSGYMSEAWIRRFKLFIMLSIASSCPDPNANPCCPDIGRRDASALAIQAAA
ncbi:hypothetical protein ACLOJK_006973 [Asimina triloba]